jgi:hypothetical protein
MSTLTHTTPFASQSRDSSSYIPPSGAPGFRPWQSASEEEEALRQSHLRNDSVGSEEDWSVRLVGRRPETTPVLMEGEAKQLRAYLPPRQKVSETWSLLYSIDQRTYRFLEHHLRKDKSPLRTKHLLTAMLTIARPSHLPFLIPT